MRLSFAAIDIEVDVARDLRKTAEVWIRVNDVHEVSVGSVQSHIFVLISEQRSSGVKPLKQYDVEVTIEYLAIYKTLYAHDTDPTIRKCLLFTPARSTVGSRGFLALSFLGEYELERTSGRAR